MTQPRTTQPRLTELSLDARSHFEVSVHGAILLVVHQLRGHSRTSDLGAVLRRHPFLSGYLDAALPFVPPGMAWDELHCWWADAVGEWEAPVRDRLPLCRLADALVRDRLAVTQLVVAGLVEEDSRFGRVFAELTGGGARRPTVEAVAAITAPLAVADAPDPVAVAAASIDDELLVAAATDAPRSEWTLRPPAELWEALRGGEPSRYTPTGRLPELATLVATEEFLTRCRETGAGLGDLDLVILRGSAGSDRVAFAGGLCRAAGRGTLELSPATPPTEGDGRLGDRPVRVGLVAAALGAVPMVVLDPGPGETVTLARGALRGPIVAVLGRTGGVDGAGHDRSVTLELPRLDAADRAHRWRIALRGGPEADVDAIAIASGLQGRHIDQVAASATALAGLDGSTSVSLRHVRQAASQLHRQLLDELTVRLDVAGDWSDVVVGDFTAAKLAELETRCRHRERISNLLPGTYGRGGGVGVRALFTGSSGTGKTLAATVLGSRLGLDVHRLDLASVVDKYVGETEKNLHRVLSAAEELDVVLLIDEGDALLGRRTEVRSANDRFANQETNFLLQRLEQYRGIVVVTTNAPDQVDGAFQRRMDAVVDFLPPSPRERVEIWRLHLPPDHTVSEGLLRELAQRCVMTGGQIRNAVVHAILLALDAGRPVGDPEVERAVASEYRKAGASSPYDPSGRRVSVSHARVFQAVVP